MSSEFNLLLQSAPRWQWYWEDMCGPNGFEFWSLLQHDIGLCFQQLCLQIPFLYLFAIISAFYFGSNVGFVIRSSKELYYINLRCFICLLLAILPIVQIIIDINFADIIVQPIDLFLSATEVITWLVHFAFLTALRRKLGPCPRGPILLLVMWSIVAILTVISFRSHLIIYNNSISSPSMILSLVCSSISLALQILYALTLLPGASSDSQRNYSSRYEQIGERTSLLDDANGYYLRYERLYTGRSEENEADFLGVAMEDTPFLSRLLFYWVHSLMRKGVEGSLNNADALYDLPMDLTSTTLGQKLDKALIGNVDELRQASSQLRDTNSLISPGEFGSTSTSALIPDVYVRRHNISLFRALHRCFGWQFYGIGILKLIADCSGFAGPLLLNKLVSFIENKSENISTGYLFALGLCITTLIAAFCNVHFNFKMCIVGLKIRGAIVTAIYRKTLTASSTILNSKFSVGEIVNFMSTDTDRIVNSCPSFHAVWSIPFQLSVTLYLLYDQLGIAFLAGVIFSIILIPINKLIANKIGSLSTKMMKKKDARVQLMTETLRGIRTLKFHVWEKHFIQSILHIRDGELKYLKGRKYLDALCVYFWATTPVLISILTFTTYVLLGNKLTAATVFTSIALLNMLIGPLNAFPWVLNGVTEAWVSIKRIQALLDVYDLDYDKYYDNTLLNTSNAVIVIKNGQFSWGNVKHSDDEKQTVKTENVMTTSRRKKITKKVRGTLLESPGHIQQKQLVYTEVGASSSQPSSDFVTEDYSSDMDSISSERNSERIVQSNYQFHLTSVNLLIKKGQFVGIMGSVGSGKSTLLASIIAEIEKNTGHIGVHNRKLGFGYVPQQPWLQRGTVRDNILFGKVYDERRYKLVLKACCLEDDIHMFPHGDLTGIGDSGNTLSGGQKARIALARAVYQDKPIYIMDDILSAVDAHVAKHIFQHCLLGLLKNKTRLFCTHHLQYLLHTDHLIVMENGCISKQGIPSDILTDIEEILLPDSSLSQDSSVSITDEIDLKSADIMKEQTVDNEMFNRENHEIGSVDTKVYGIYWKSIGRILSLFIILSMVLMQASRNITDVWLSIWVSASFTPTNSTNLTNIEAPYSSTPLADPKIMYYLTIYAILAGINSVFTLFRAFLFAYGGIQAAKRLHQKLLKKVIHAKLRFFDISPLGRILNRFSSDTYTVDDSLPFILNILLAQLFGLMGSVAVTIYGLPWLCLVLAPLIPVYHWLQEYYRLTSRELKRLSSLTLSPVYSHFNETLQGLATIRAFGANQRFKRDNEEYLETNQKTQFASNVANQWLNLRLQFIGVAMVSGVGVIAVIQHQFDVVDPGLVGLAISYALSVTGLLGGVINAFTETEREMIAVERVNQYIEEVQAEDLNYALLVAPPYGWPARGSIQFSEVVLRYRGEYTFQMVTFDIRGGEKVGIVGRTGAGKSSLFAALFRMIDYRGEIWIDDENISYLPLEILRTRLSIIPQEPFLFTGTVRENLDPLNEYRSQEMWNALHRCNLTGVIKQIGGLQASLGPDGQKLSVGQRQLFCLARAVLRKAKILCIDEATANVDMETDRQIQQTIRTTFAPSTVITIAHRVQTIMDSDRVMVMDDGKIIEFDSPKVLLADPSSQFYQLATQQQIL